MTAPIGADKLPAVVSRPWYVGYDSVDGLVDIDDRVDSHQRDEDTCNETEQYPSEKKTAMLLLTTE